MTRVVLCSPMAPLWPGHGEGVLSLPQGGMTVPQLGSFLSGSLEGGPALLLMPPEGPPPGSIALARSLAGLSGRTSLRRLKASGLAASTIARICARSSDLGREALDGLAVLLDARIPDRALGQTPVPGWIGHGPPWLHLPGLWWLWHKDASRPRVFARPPTIPLEGVWQAETRGGLPPGWWPADGPPIVWHDGLAQAWRPGWISLARLPPEAEIEQLVGQARRLEPPAEEVRHGPS